MSMTLSGNGTITGLVSGGLPDATITSAELASNAVDSQTLTLLNASGSAPVYACRAWVNFNGTGTVAIRASGNVSSITDNGTGIYTVNFSAAMPDTNYCAVGSLIGGTTSWIGTSIVSADNTRAKTTSSVPIITFQLYNQGGTNTQYAIDVDCVDVSIFR